MTELLRETTDLRPAGMLPAHLTTCPVGEGVQSRDREPAITMRVRLAVLWKRYRIYNFKALSGGKWRFCSTAELPKCLVF